MADWTSASGELAAHILAESESTLKAYAVQPTLVREHVGIEANIFASGYGQRQVFELVQNAADAIFVGRTSGRVRIVLTDQALYCANEGAPIDRDGATAILMAYLSAKRGEQIGHFGLGFKSVLSVTSTPQFFCQAGSFGFDKARSFERIRTVLPDVEDVPVLRLGHLLDPHKEAAKDRTLASLMEWATTVVRLPRNVGESAWLSNELARFPAEFLVFSPHVRRLELHDAPAREERVIEVSIVGPVVTIADGKARSQWRTFHHRLQTSDLTVDQLSDAEEATRKREALPLIWAVPREVARSRGRFWAFFPTETETTLTGVLNAPWKTNADRQNLLDGPFNRRLLEEFVHVVVRAWPDLIEKNDPGSVLDLLPAREQDAKNWADRAMGEGLFRDLAGVFSVPGLTGELSSPAAVLLRPDLVTSDGGRQWLTDFPDAEAEGKLEWVHPSVETRERRPRVERLRCQKGSLCSWLEDVAAEVTPASSLRALALVEALFPRLNYASMPEVKAARIVLTSGLTLEAPGARLCLPVEGVAVPEGISVVHSDLVADKSARDTLKKLEVQPVSVEVQLKHALGLSSPDWERVWSLLRKLPVDRAQAIVRQHSRDLHLRNLAGMFSPAHQTLLPGSVADPAVVDDHHLIVDMAFHETDLALLKAAGAVNAPVAEYEAPSGAWYETYLTAARAVYRKVEPRGYDSSIEPAATPKVPGPMHVLVRGSVALKTRFTEHLLPLIPAEGHWTFHYRTKPNSYKRVQVTEPVRWCISRDGLLNTSLGPRKLSALVSPALEQWKLLLPVAVSSRELLARLKVPTSLPEMTEAQWEAAFRRSQELVSGSELEICWAFYGAVCALRPAPEEISAFASARAMTTSPASVMVTDDRERFVALHEAGVATVLVPNRTAVDGLVGRWGLAEASATVTVEVSGESEPVLDALPGLAPHVSSVVAEATAVQPCSRIWLEIRAAGETRHREVSFARTGSVLHYRDNMPSELLLGRVEQELGLSLNEAQLAAALAHLHSDQQRRAVERVLAATTVAAKLLASIGEEAIRRQLPSKVVVAAMDRASELPPGEALAEAAIAVFGVELLKRYRYEFAAAALGPPSQWTGGRSALEFCDRLGFPPEYAGFEVSRRDPMLEVDGPIELKPLHEFQQPIADRIRRFFLQASPDRGLLSLPTGAGKTRVVVEALIDALRETRGRQLVIWIAQSDELCEQAVHAWAQAWRALGPAMRLRVSRLWGSTNSRVRQTEDAHVVVATYQSLKSRLSWPDYAWLKNARCLVIDEAHGSTAPSYTEILEALGVTARETSRHLIGLTATPFRGSGWDEVETRWLANRYGKNRFDHDVIPGDPYPYLQNLGVLAQVEQEVLEGREITLTAEEVQHLQQYNELPADAERRLGEDDARNRMLVNSIGELDPTWPVLLFATSVDHAHLMAALLSLQGIAAKAISGNTDVGARRHYVEQFKAGKIRVLTNYGVLTTGFDAPSVRALIIARPVYSRGLYQQMIGRGLRGPKNGGKERCLIINVADNVAQYGGQLAFRGFEHLWRPWAGGELHGE